MHPLLRYVLVATPLAVLVFLSASDFFTAWDGRAVSVRAATVEGPATLQVLVVDDERDHVELWWDADTVKSLKLPVDNTGVPPATLPDEAALTRKQRFSLFYTVTPSGGESTVVPTTSARALSVALLLWFLGLFLHNMWLSGSPFSWERRTLELPKSQPPSGQQAGSPVVRSRKGPPPPKRRRGSGRRR